VTALQMQTYMAAPIRSGWRDLSANANDCQLGYEQPGHPAELLEFTGGTI